MTRILLADRLYEVCVASRLAPEHLEVAGLLKDAIKFVVNEESSRNIREELDNRTWAIESNIDLIEWPSAPIWIEWHLPARAIEQTEQLGIGGRTGCLISPHPEHRELISILTAWEEPASDAVHHSYSTALIDLEQAHQHALLARTRYSKDNEDSFERLMALLGVTLPDGFRDELVLRHKGNVGVIERTMRLGTAEIPFLLAVLVARQAVGGLMVDQGESHAEMILTSAPVKTMFERLGDWFWKAPPEGLFRRVKSRKPVLKWHRAS